METQERSITVSAQDREKIAALQKSITDLEEQIATIVGGIAGLDDPRIARPDGAEKGIRVVGGSSVAGRAPFCVIYMDPPGICYPC